jgi:aerobic C4-dicarboxylate transport protein
MNNTLPHDGGVPPLRKRHFDPNALLYTSVLVAVVLGAIFGIVAPSYAATLEPIAKAFVALIKLIVTPVIFCTIVIGIGSIAQALTVGKIGGISLFYFLVMSTLALAVGLVVGNLIHPGAGINIASAQYVVKGAAKGTDDFLLSIIPTTFFSAFTEGNILQVLVVSLLIGFAIQGLGEKAAPAMKVMKYFQGLVFRVMVMIFWAAPVGSFAAIAYVVGKNGASVIGSLGMVLLGFYITCILFIVGILGSLLWIIARMNIFLLLKYLYREYLLILGTSSSESALPRLLAKMEHLGVDKSVVGVTIPTGYSFNLDGTAIYLTMASLFIATGMGKPMNLHEQIGLLVFMIIAAKGAAGVTGAGLATLASGLQVFRPDLVNGIGAIVGIDRFMSEGRALTNFTGNAVGAILVGVWTKRVDLIKARNVLSGKNPFDEAVLSHDFEH